MFENVRFPHCMAHWLSIYLCTGIIVATCTGAWAAPRERSPTKVILTPQAKAEAVLRDQQRADQLRREGRQLYKNGRYAEAIERYEAAFDAVPDNELLYSIAVSYQQLRLWRRCIESFDKYLKLGPMGPKRARAVNAKENCETRVEVRQMLNIQTEPAGANVFVGQRDEPMVGQTPLSITLPSGSHRIWIELDGYLTLENEIQIQRGQPFELALELQAAASDGQIFVDSNVVDAQVYLDGERLRFTPFTAPVSVRPGSYQLVVERDGYRRFKKQVTVTSKGLIRVPVPLERTAGVRTWRTPGGWGSIVAGLGAIGLGIMAKSDADGLFNDTPRFDELSNQQTVGYVLGSTLLTMGVGLLTWDALGRVIPTTHLNPRFGHSVGHGEGRLAAWDSFVLGGSDLE